jgi:RNA recognition motif-containing protein
VTPPSTDTFPPDLDSDLGFEPPDLNNVLDYVPMDLSEVSMDISPDEFESRTISLSNINPVAKSDDIRLGFSRFGDIHTIDMSQIHLGIALVQFYDIRAACRARTSKLTLNGRPISALFQLSADVPDPQNAPNNGTLVFFHLRPGVTDEMMEGELSRFGEIREIRSCPGKDDQRFVEFWDTRAAESALSELKGKKLFRSRITVGFSLPGGLRRPGTAFSLPRFPTVERVAQRKLSCPPGH